MTITQAEIDDLRRKAAKCEAWVVGCARVHTDVDEGEPYEEPLPITDWCYPCQVAAILDAHKAQAERIETLEGALRPLVETARVAVDGTRFLIEGGIAAIDAARAALGETEAQPEDDYESTMPRVRGKPFRCHCGCNVFARNKRTDVFTCNACGERYQGESAALGETEEG